MKKPRLLISLLITLLISYSNAFSQEVEENETVEKWEEYIEELMEEAEEEGEGGDESVEDIQTLHDDLSELASNPLNINTITADALRRIPFLSEMQILNILDYRKKQWKFVSIYELKNIPFLDMQTIELILPFLYVGEVDNRRNLTLQNALRYGRSELLLRYDRTLEKKSGYNDFSDSILLKYPNRRYVGEPFYHSLRYSYSYYDRVQAGFVGEKDAGEAFMNSRHKGYDYYSAHFILKETGILRTLALGDYKVSFGQGLVVSNDFKPSRSMTLTQSERKNNGFRRHYSTNEYNYFRGAAATIALGHFDVSAFYSNRLKDAIADSVVLTSFKKDGLHRTEGDWSKRNAYRETSFGGNLRYSSPVLLIGLTGMTTSFGGLQVDPTPHPYNLFYFRGERISNFSVDYSLKHRRLSFYGETAMSDNGAFATVNGLQWSLSTSFKTLMLYRNYSRRYQSLYGNAFAQSTGVQNEEGIYLSLQWNPIAYWRLSSYADFFRFPWLKYNVDAPSSGKEYMLQADFTGIQKATLSVRYRYRQLERNIIVAQEATIEPTDQHRLRLQLNSNPSRKISLRTTIEGCEYNSDSRGWIISQNAGWKDSNSKIQADIYLAFFDSDDYYSRVYSREKNLFYSIYIPSFIGEGVRLAAVARYNFTSKIQIAVKAALTKFYDAETISSDNELIEGDHKTDISAQLRWKF